MRNSKFKKIYQIYKDNLLFLDFFITIGIVMIGEFYQKSVTWIFGVKTFNKCHYKLLNLVFLLFVHIVELHMQQSIFNKDINAYFW